MSKPFSSAKPWRKSNRPQQGQDKDQCPEFWLQFKVRVHRRLLSSHPCSLTCSRLLSLSDSLLESVCGACVAMGHMVAGLQGGILQGCRVLEHTGECITRWAKEPERLPPEGHGPHGPWREHVSIPCKLRSQARAKSRRAQKKNNSFFFHLRLY